MEFNDVLRALADGKELQVRCGDGTFMNVKTHEVLRVMSTNLQENLWDNTWYRIKPNTIIVNGFEIAAPETEEPQHEQMVYLPSCVNIEHWSHAYWFSKGHHYMLERGIVHLTKENAIAHAKAMLGINPNG